MRRLGFEAAILATVTAGAAWLSCGGDDFTPGEDTTTTSTSGPTTGTGGSGASGGGGAATSSSGMAGGTTASAGGAGGGPNRCKPGEYEDHVTHDCVDCSDLGTIAFDPASIEDEALAGPGGEPGFPRVQHINGKRPMVYMYFSGDYELGVSDDAPWDTGGPIGSLNTAGDESGPLLLPIGVDIPGMAKAPLDSYVLFDRDSGNKPEIYAAIYGGAGAVLPGVINQGTLDLHIAYAYNTNSKRAWWTSKRLSSSNLVFGLFTTQLAGGSPTATPVPLTLAGGCVSDFPDVAAWVTPDGKHLFFHAKACDGSSDNLKTWYVALDTSTGQAIGEAVEISEIDTDGFDTAFPSLAPDFCRIFYSTSETSGYFHVRSAKRW